MEILLNISQSGTVTVLLLLAFDLLYWGSAKTPSWYSVPAGFVLTSTGLLWFIYIQGLILGW